MPADRNNAFDLIRLLAALQVLLMHGLTQFGFAGPLLDALWYFPGVPIFFVVSGYLIAQSWDTSASAGDFAAKRFLRIYPGLWGALAFSAVLIAVLHPIDTNTFVLWLMAQATVGQNWHPDALRTFGTGVVNAALWSVCVEIAFYAMMPLLARLRTVWLMVLAALSFATLYAFQGLPYAFTFKLILVSPAPWLGMFLTGVIFYRYRLRPSLPFGVGLFVVVFALSQMLPESRFLMQGTNMLGLPNFLAVACLVFAVAFARPIRLPHDISYGLYLYHMPLMNAVMMMETTPGRSLAIMLYGSVILAVASWALIERPLSKGRRPAKPVPASVGEPQIG